MPETTATDQVIDLYIEHRDADCYIAALAERWPDGRTLELPAEPTDIAAAWALADHLELDRADLHPGAIHTGSVDWRRRYAPAGAEYGDLLYAQLQRNHRKRVALTTR